MNRIKELRKEKGLTLKELSSSTQIPISTLSSYEKEERNPKIDKFISLAKYFNVPVPYLQGLGISRSEAINHIVDKMIDKNERDAFFSSFTGIEHNLQENLTRSDVDHINNAWGSGLRFSDDFVENSIDRVNRRYFIKNLIDNNNRQALEYLVGKYVPLVNDYKFLASVPNDVDAYYKAIDKKYNDDRLAIAFSNIKNAIDRQYNDDDLVNLSSSKNKEVVLFESICDLFISDIGVKSSLLSYSDDRKVEINKKVRALFNLLTTDTDDKRVLEIRENVKDQLDAYANDNED
ncbi:helix-turn-helix domain-containing protein [Ligilactobacillus salivarius]|uniref:helix-turn-helix domain-containing protein n=1 Tax=Ligilactobacillus salivarius TaxID=1624 RepID=UPI003994DE7C